MKPGLYFSADKDGVIYARVMVNGTMAKFSTKLKVKKKDFKCGGVMPRDRYTRSVIQNLDDLKEKFNNIKIEPHHNAKIIRDMLKGEYIEGQNEFTLMNAMDHGLSLAKIALKESSYNEYKSVVDHFRKWFKYHTGYEDVAVSAISSKIGISYVEECLQDNQSTRRIKNKLSYLSSFYENYILDYQDSVAIPHNPFMTAMKLVARMRSNATQADKKEFILNYWHSTEEVEKIKNFKFIGTKRHRYERYRWAAMWQIVTGWAFDDMGSDDWEVCDVGNKKYIRIERGKSGNICYIPYSEDIDFVYNKLRENCLAGRLFPFKRFITNKVSNLVLKKKEYGKYRRFLKKFEVMLGMEMNTHKFRHTFGMSMHKKGYNMRQIAKMMGHSTSATTEGFYVTETEEEIVEKMFAIEPEMS